MWSSCDIDIPEGTELIIYAHQENEEQYGVGLCSGLLYLNDVGTQPEKADRELRILATPVIMMAFKIKYLQTVNFCLVSIIIRQKGGIKVS